MEYNDNKDTLGAHTLEYYDQYESTISNGEARIPICICVDTSSSMNFLINDNSAVEVIEGTEKTEDGNRVRSVRAKYDWVKLTSRIDELKKVLGKMIVKMQSNDLLRRSAVICIVTFDKFANCFCEFSDISKVSPNSPRNISVGRDSTNMSKGLRMSLDRLDQQIALGHDAGNDSYRPVLIFMSDGSPTDGVDADKLRREVRRRADNNTIKVIPIGIGLGSYNDARLSWLKEMSPDGKVYRMNVESEFEEVFDAITTRIQRTSQVIAVDDIDTNIAHNSEEDDNGSADSTRYGIQTPEDVISDFFNS